MEIQVTKPLKPQKAAQEIGSILFSRASIILFREYLPWFHHFRVTHLPSTEVFQHKTDTSTARWEGLCLFFPPTERNLRLDAFGRTQLLSITYISPEAFVLVHGFNPQCFLSA